MPLQGPEGTPYHTGVFIFDLYFPPQVSASTHGLLQPMLLGRSASRRWVCRALIQRCWRRAVPQRPAEGEPDDHGRRTRQIQPGAHAFVIVAALACVVLNLTMPSNPLCDCKAVHRCCVLYGGLNGRGLIIFAHYEPTDIMGEQP